MIGAATGCLSSPLAAIVATRWFVARRGLATGLLSAAYASGQLVFLPSLAFATREAGWEWAAALVALAAAVAIPVALLLIRDHPADRAVPAFGATEVEAPPAAPGNPFARSLAALRDAAGTRIFWLLAATFFICGATTVGIIGTHLIPAAHDHGIGEVQAASLLAVIGVFDLIGVTTSGWLTDRWDPARLLFCFYALRGLSLFFLPLVLGETALGTAAFVVVFGLDWVATVPPTVALTVSAFGRERGGRGVRLDLRRAPARGGVGRVGRRGGPRLGRHVRPGVPRDGAARDRRRGDDPWDERVAPGAADRGAPGDDDRHVGWRRDAPRPPRRRRPGGAARVRRGDGMRRRRRLRRAAGGPRRGPVGARLRGRGGRRCAGADGDVRGRQGHRAPPAATATPAPTPWRAGG